MTFEPIEHEPDDYGPADTPAKPSAARTGGFPRRFWLALTGRPTGAERCRPVTVQGADGEPVHTAVLGDVPMSDESRQAFGEIVRATQRRFVDSHSPWSQWLTDQLLDHEWTSSGLVEASGHVFDLKQVSRWLHSQDVPEPWAAVLVAKAFGASVAEALRAAEHGVLVDAVLEEDEQPQDDGDVRAVAVLAAADNYNKLHWAVSNLIALFADRIEALEARDAKVGGSNG